MAFIDVRDVRFSYDLEAGVGQEVLHGVSLQIEQGEFVALLGDRKSTRLNSSH